MALAVLALFVVSLGYGVVVPLLPALAGGRDSTTEGALALAYATYAAAKIGVQVPGGVWVDRAGAGRVLRLALAVFALSLAGFLVEAGLGFFAVLRAIEGAATGLVYPACFALALRSGPPERSGRRLGLVAALGTSGLLVGPALGMGLVHLGPRVPVALALAATGGVLVWALCARLPGAAEASGARRSLDAEWRALVQLAATPAFLALMLPVAFNKLTFSAFQGLLPLVGPDVLDLASQGVLALFILTGVGFAGVQPLAGRVADRFSPRQVVLVLSGPLLVSLVLLSRATSAWTFGGAYLAYIALSSMIFTATMKHAARAFGTTDTFGGVFGTLGTLTDLATIVGPLVFLNLYGYIGVQVFAVMAGVGLLFALAHRRGTRPVEGQGV